MKTWLCFLRSWLQIVSSVVCFLRVHPGSTCSRVGRACNAMRRHSYSERLGIGRPDRSSSPTALANCSACLEQRI
ncbi:hypothetical protein JB92DRAFT_2965453 [Gautieria morchelliformis]|nr:hypothetical protein JB92DRAFT_2965453 [Gautieria morchelliformis]